MHERGKLSTEPQELFQPFTPLLEVQVAQTDVELRLRVLRIQATLESVCVRLFPRESRVVEGQEFLLPRRLEQVSDLPSQSAISDERDGHLIATKPRYLKSTREIGIES